MDYTHIKLIITSLQTPAPFKWRRIHTQVFMKTSADAKKQNKKKTLQMDPENAYIFFPFPILWRGDYVRIRVHRTSWSPNSSLKYLWNADILSHVG